MGPRFFFRIAAVACWILAGLMLVSNLAADRLVQREGERQVAAVRDAADQQEADYQRQLREWEDSNRSVDEFNSNPRSNGRMFYLPRPERPRATTPPDPPKPTEDDKLAGVIVASQSLSRSLWVAALALMGICFWIAGNYIGKPS